MNVLSVTSEIFPLIKTGGLADVTGALPKVLSARGYRTRSLIPGYTSVLAEVSDARPVHFFPDLFGNPAWLLEAECQGLDLLVLNAPALYDRPGGPYVGEDGIDHRTTGSALPFSPTWPRPVAGRASVGLDARSRAHP